MSLAWSRVQYNFELTMNVLSEYGMQKNVSFNKWYANNDNAPLHDLWPHPPRHHICASTQGSSVPSLNKIDAEIKKLAHFKQTLTQKWCTWPYSTWTFDPYMTFDLTLLGTIHVQVPKDHLYQV